MTGYHASATCACGGPKSFKSVECLRCAKATRRRRAAETNPPCPDCGAPKLRSAARCSSCHLARKMGDDRSFPLGGVERARFGAIITFKNSDGKTLTLHRVGPVRTVIADLCDEAVMLDETFLVIAISTPESVFTDLQGHRNDPRGNFNDHPRLPEVAHLSGKLAHMVHPDLRP